MNRKSRKKETLTPYERRKRRREKRFSTAPKTTGQKVAGAVIDNICWIVGCSLYSIGVVAFALPNSIAQSGTTVLTEVPEMFGAETILMDRAADRGVFDGTVSLINDFKHYFRKFDQPIYENPSPGNKKGGITTLEEKSLGCVQKGGAQPVVDVLTYAQPVTKPGLNLLQAPGNDLVAASALALSGCQLVLFTTGRGTPFGSFVPTMKISTNTQLAEFKANWIDFNAGTLVEDEEPQAVLDRFID